MNWSVKEAVKVLLVVAVLAGGALPGASDVLAQEKGSTLAQQVQGSWILVSIYNEQGGKKFNVFGTNPKGLLIVTPDGRYSSIITHMKGINRKKRAIFEGIMASFGTYTVVSDKDHKVIQHIEGDSFPNWDGRDMMHVVTVTGDEMKVTFPTPPIGNGMNYVVYKRAK